MPYYSTAGKLLDPQMHLFQCYMCISSVVVLLSLTELQYVCLKTSVLARSGFVGE